MQENNKCTGSIGSIIAEIYDSHEKPLLDFRAGWSSDRFERVLEKELSGKALI